MRALTTNSEPQDHCACVSPLQLHFSEECLAPGWTVTEPHTTSLVRWVAAARVSEALSLGYSWYEGQVICVSNATLTATIRLKGVGFQKCLWLCRNVTFRLCERSLHGTNWYMISPLLTTDGAVRCRAVSWRWNEGSRCGERGEMFFQLLRNDPFAKLVL